ncbi:hypothetical protein [Knoellia koreensis]|uniref:Uncharacterized protein n=1 Tax=Knoellia koreensis TaxID=2730921 RepID=A0A849HK90_9MICO|nr:hypothetical protein [Knoellia sp. DB2414S]NNM46954.1 hypothetical protein [Knoellia sp. DB2414S]
MPDLDVEPTASSVPRLHLQFRDVALKVAMGYVGPDAERPMPGPRASGYRLVVDGLPERHGNRPRTYDSARFHDLWLAGVSRKEIAEELRLSDAYVA